MTITYLVGPNGSGKTRALNQLASQNGAYFIQKLRIAATVSPIEDVDNPQHFIKRFQNQPEQIALRLLRANLGLQLKVFGKLSKKLGRTFSVHVVERQPQFQIFSALSPDQFEEITIPTYHLNAESSGLREILVLLTLIHSDLATDFCIDEPELSLHPEAQRFLKEELEILSASGRNFWVATHSPVIFSPTTINDLGKAIFFSDPQKPYGNRPDFARLSAGQESHLERSLLKLNSAQWALAHSQAVLFCEGYRDRAIISKVCDRLGIRLSEKDVCVLDVGGKDEFSTLWLLCFAIQKTAYFVGDLDCLIECKLLDKFNSNEIVNTHLSGVANNIVDYLLKNLRHPLGNLFRAVESVDRAGWPPELVNQLPKFNGNQTIEAHEKTRLLEVLLRNQDDLIKLIPDQTDAINMVCGAFKRACKILQDVGFFVMPRGTIETMYAGVEFSPQTENEKRQLFNDEWERLRNDPVEMIRERYCPLVEFIETIANIEFDFKEFVQTRITSTLAKLQTILLEQHPITVEELETLPNYKMLRTNDVIEITKVGSNGQQVICRGKSKAGFKPAFEFMLDSNIGLTDDRTFWFTDDKIHSNASVQ